MNVVSLKNYYSYTMIKSQESHDFELACKLYQEDNCFGLTENAILPKNKDKENYKPRTLIDQTLELIDPTPNIYTLFMQFNERFFWNVLLPVEVKWSPRMTSCAGVCTFHPRNRQCVISLSAPLLKLRPRKDLVETLLHEMIHGYLFLTNNNRDRDGHGPEFCKHMNRINKEAGTKITIYHSFNDEVKLYQQHWWRCNGPCRDRAPYFGIVRRAMNRAPGPNDFWWQRHQQLCGGQYTKIKEPENYKAKTTKNKEKANLVSKNNNSTNNLFDWFKKPTSTTEPTATPIPINVKPLSNTPDSLNKYKIHRTNTNNGQGRGVKGPTSSNSSHKSITVPTNTFTPTKIKPVSNNPDLSNGFKKLGSSTNSVHGWGVRGPTGLKNSPKFSFTPPVASTPQKIKPHSNTPGTLNRFKKLGNSTNNVHGWGTGGPNGSNNTQKSTSVVSNNPKFSSSGTLGGSNIGRSNLLSKFDNRKNHPELNPNIKVSKGITGASTIAKAGKPTIDSQSTNVAKLVECPICSNFVPISDIDKHVDSCLIISDDISSTKSQVKADETSTTQKRKINMITLSSKQPKLDQSENIRMTNCPVCDKSFEFTVINKHLDKCLSDPNEQDNSTIKLDNKNVASEMKNESIVSISSTSSNSSSSSITEDLKDLYSNPKPQKKSGTNISQKCLVCNMFIPPEMSLNDHLEDCIGSLFNDDSELSIDYDDVKMSETSLEVPVDQNNRYLCPVCMVLISESFMNQHLDECLEDT